MNETDMVDWKRGFPGNTDDARRELAKDVAALGNHRGGILVYGVEEDGNCQATAIVGVDASDDRQRTIRQTLAKRVRPLIAGIAMTALTSDDGTKSVLVVSVPRSSDAPHLVGWDVQFEQFRAPTRHGTTTHWMDEGQIERAYRDRFNSRQDQRDRLANLIDQAGSHIDRRVGVWLIGAGYPRVPIALGTPSVAREEIVELVSDSDTKAQEVAAGAWRLTSGTQQELVNPRMGLRRGIVRTARQEGPDALADWLHLELHHDGGTVVAIHLSDYDLPTSDPRLDQVSKIMDLDVERFATAFVSLADAHGRRLGDASPFGYLVSLLAPTATPKVAIMDRRMSERTRRAWTIDGSRYVQALLQVEGEIPVAAPVEDTRRVARQIALDVLHQFNVDRLHILK
jgi:hypothetical protein